MAENSMGSSEPSTVSQRVVVRDPIGELWLGLFSHGTQTIGKSVEDVSLPMHSHGIVALV